MVEGQGSGGRSLEGQSLVGKRCEGRQGKRPEVVWADDRRSSWPGLFDRDAGAARTLILHRILLINKSEDG